MVRGEVNSLLVAKGDHAPPAAAVAYVRGADIDYYIRSAGGATIKADEGRAYVTQPNGKVETKHRTALLFESNPRPQAGAIVVVPQKDALDHRDWIAVAQTSLSLLASLITVAVLVRRQ
jgi:hypothetical protein